MGRFITRVRPGDRELQGRLLAEARRCYASEVPISEAVPLLVEMAGDNPNAFQGIGGKDARNLLRTPEGQAILRLIGLADSTRKNQNRVGVQRIVGKRRTPEEEHLASMPIGDAFDLLAERDPQLRENALDVVRAAEASRANGEDYAGVRRAVDEVVIRALRITGPPGGKQTGLAASGTANQVVVTRLYELAGVNVIDFDAKGWPGGV
jgi:hypothetical protein